MSTTEKNGRKKAGAFEIHITGDGRKVQSDAHGEIEDLLAGGGYFLGSILKQIGVQEGTEEFAEISGGIMEAVSHYLKDGVNGDPEDSSRQTAEKVYEKKNEGRREPVEIPEEDLRASILAQTDKDGRTRITLFGNGEDVLKTFAVALANFLDKSGFKPESEELKTVLADISRMVYKAVGHVAEIKNNPLEYVSHEMQ